MATSLEGYDDPPQCPLAYFWRQILKASRKKSENKDQFLETPSLDQMFTPTAQVTLRVSQLGSGKSQDSFPEAKH